ncbi:MAG: DMT family transporter [Pseudomonadota bacterium]
MTHTLRAALWMIGAIASFSSMAVAGREASVELDTFEIMMYRSAFGVLIVISLAGWAGTLKDISRDQIGLHLVRNVAHFTGQNLWFFAVTVIPLAQVFALEFTTPLWVIMLSPLILSERLSRMRVIAAVMGFVGILMVARPGVSGINEGVISAASCALFFALSIMLTKKLTRTQTITCILFYLTTMQLVFGVVTAGYDGDIALPSLTALPYVIIIGAAGLAAHFCLTKALSLAPATVVMPIDFARLPVIAVVGMLLYQETIDPWVFAGAVIIFAGNYLNIWSETKAEK